MRLEEVIRRPLLSEKVMDMKENDNIVAFEVHPSANKIDVKRAVESQFKEAKVEEVRIARAHAVAQPREVERLLLRFGKRRVHAR